VPTSGKCRTPTFRVSALHGFRWRLVALNPASDVGLFKFMLCLGEVGCLLVRAWAYASSSVAPKTCGLKQISPPLPPPRRNASIMGTCALGSALTMLGDGTRSYLTLPLRTLAPLCAFGPPQEIRGV
jgi:hypothetical protein